MLIKKIIAAAALAAVSLSAAAIDMKVASYTTNSVTFALTGKIPSSHPNLDGLSYQIDLLYTGSLYAGPSNIYASNTLSASPVSGTSFWVGNTGGFASFGVPLNYSWIDFHNDLTGLSGTKDFVTLSFGGNFLNTLGTGSFDLYWGNLAGGIDAAQQRNVLLSSVKVVNGVVNGKVPEPGSVALLGLAALGLAAVRRRKSA